MKNYNEEITILKNSRKQIIEKIIMFEKNNNLGFSKDYVEGIRNLSFELMKVDRILNEKQKEIIYNSYFDYKIISKIMSDIIRIYEGKNFVYKEIPYHPESKRRIIFKDARVLIFDEKLKYLSKNCDIAKIYSVIKNGDGIVLDWDFYYDYENSYVKFYKLNDKGELKSNIKLNKFPYLKRFIDYVINYSMSNKNITEEKLEQLKNHFIEDNEEDIREYHEVVKINEENEMKEKIDKNIKYRDKQLKKALKK